MVAHYTQCKQCSGGFYQNRTTVNKHLPLVWTKPLKDDEIDVALFKAFYKYITFLSIAAGFVAQSYAQKSLLRCDYLLIILLLIPQLICSFITKKSINYKIIDVVLFLADVSFDYYSYFHIVDSSAIKQFHYIGMDAKEIQDINIRLLKQPHFASGIVVKGFGRGSKELGIPTANFTEEVVSNLPSDLNTGVYYGWSRVDNGDIFKMVLSVGWNPYYKNEKKSMETHIMHEFPSDFYGSTLQIVMTGYIRPELNFESLDALIVAINNDIKVAHEKLDQPDQLAIKENILLTGSS